MPLSPETIDELKVCLHKMEQASKIFYDLATHTGNHAFIEFTGLMNEYITVCKQSMKAGIDFRQANVHNGTKLAVNGFNLDYLAEKFACIFTPVMRARPDALGTFIRAVEREG